MLETFLEKFNKSETEIINQVRFEFEQARRYLQPKIKEWQTRLYLYNNQRRDKQKVGDPLLFTIFQTLLASLYSDKLKVKFLPREEGDIEVADNLNSVADYDYDKMDKSVIDYEWDWDTLFFGRGLVLFEEFDRKSMLPKPEVVDPFSFYRDPDATSVNGNVKGYGALRFWGREILLTKSEIESNPNYFNTENLNPGRDFQKFLAKAKQERALAQGLQPQNNTDGIEENVYYDLIEWRTHIKGKKVLITLANDLTKIVRIQELKGDRWGLIDRSLFPIAHDWDGVSVPDLTEDKQRARAVLQNLGLDAAKADVYPMYLIDDRRIKNKADLNFGFNKFVRIDGQTAGAVEPLNKPTIHQQVSWIMQLLDEASQRALATPEIQQGVAMQQKRTATELALISTKVDTRYSLAAKIFGWSEKDFWRQWYWLYKNYFGAKLDKKVVRLTGAWGSEFRQLNKDNIIARVDPDVEVESSVVAEAKRVKQLQGLTNFVALAMRDPSTNKRYLLKELAKLNGLTPSQIKIILPQNYDEMKAEKENDMIEKGQLPPVSINDDHTAHLQIHARLNKSKVRDAHIEMHRVALMMHKEVPQAAPEPQQPEVPKQEQQQEQPRQPVEKFLQEYQKPPETFKQNQ